MTIQFPISPLTMVNNPIHHHNHVNPIQNESPMVVITNNKDQHSVFPPINHENLHLFTQIPQSPPSSSSSPSFSSDCDTWGEYSVFSSPFDSKIRKGGDFIGWLSIGFRVLRSKVSSFRGRVNWSFGLRVFTAVVVVVMLMRWKRKNRRRNLTPNESRLMQIILEKDGKIAQLLHQIAQMNEILIDQHKALAAKVVK